jgi:hypothetical protein
VSPPLASHDLPDGHRLLPGRTGRIIYTKAAVVAVVAVFCLVRLYLGTGVLLAVAFVAIAVTAFRFFTPNELFPVAYRGRTAHVM